MAKKIKIAASTLAVIVGLGSIAACSSTSSPSASTSPAASASKLTNGKFDPPVTITTVRGIDNTAKFKNEETIEDNVHVKWAKEALGVEIKSLWSAQMADNSYDTKLKLMLSSGEKMPDVMFVLNKDTLNMFIDSGKVMKVNDLFEKYAGKVWKDAMAEEPAAWLPFQRGKDKMAIPRLQVTTTSEPVLWIRKDWMDKLGLQEPKTLTELETIMDAFTNKDPDGDGQKNTVALDFAMKDQMIGYPVGDISWLFGAFGAIPNQWTKDASGKLVYGSIQPGVKQALAKLNEWKTKGYIPEDVALHDWNKIGESVASGKLGIVAGANWFPAYPGSLVYAKDPTANYQAYPFPAGPDGKKGQMVSDPFSGAFLISKDISNEALEAFFHYMNTLWDASASEDPFVLKGFQENYDYVIQEGKAVFANDKIPGGQVQTFKYTLQGNMPQPNSKYVEVGRKIAAGETLTKNDIAFNNANGVNPDDPLQKMQGKATLITIAQKGNDIPNLFTGPTTSTQLSRGEFLKKLELDTYTQIIYSKAPVEEFDNFVKKWQSSGGDQITKEVNDWYNSVK